MASKDQRRLAARLSKAARLSGEPLHPVHGEQRPRNICVSLPPNPFLARVHVSAIMKCEAAAQFGDASRLHLGDLAVLGARLHAPEGEEALRVGRERIEAGPFVDGEDAPGGSVPGGTLHIVEIILTIETVETIRSGAGSREFGAAGGLLSQAVSSSPIAPRSRCRPKTSVGISR